MSFTHRSGYRTFAGTITAFSMQQDKISIDLKLPTKWEDLSDKQLRYVFVLLAQGYTATEVKAYCLCRRAGLKVLHRYGNNGWVCRHGKQEFRSSRNAAQVERRGGACSHLCRGAAGVAVTKPSWQQRRHRQNEPREQREQRRACSHYAESRPRKTESTSATPQVVQPEVLRFGDEYQGVLRI